MIKLDDAADCFPGAWGEENPDENLFPMLVLGVGNVTNDGRIKLEGATKRFLSKNQSYAIAQKDDLLVVKSSGSAQNIRSGKTAICPQELDGKIACSNFMMRLVPRKDVVEPFLLWAFLNSEFTKKFIRKIAQSSTYPNITWDTLKKIELPFPESGQQKPMAEHLKKQFDAVEQAKTQSEQQSQELGALVTAGLRDSLAGGSKPLAAEIVLDETSRGVGSRWREFPVIGATRAGWSPAKEPVGKQPERYKLVEPGMVFYNPMRIMIGSIAAVTRPDQIGITSPDYVVVRPKPEFLHPVWFYEWLRSPHHGGQFIAKLARGAVRERMLFTRLGKGIIPVPPLPAQEQFAALCVAARTTQEKIAALQTELEALPNALLREAFNGHS